jgi:uncharacterized hydrophobic protein (TIGR00271 family)
MPLKELVHEVNGIFTRKGLGVWGIQDYYTRLEQIAADGAKMTLGYLMMVLASAAMATGGLLMNSSAVVIGSMCVAPFLGPSRAVCIGGLFRNRTTFFKGLIKQIFGLLILGSGTAYIVTVWMIGYAGELAVTHEILLRSMPSRLYAVLSVFIAISAGIAASLALSAEPRSTDAPWGEVIDAVIGVEVAISLIPPAAVIGIGFALGRPVISWNAFLLLLVNVLGLDILGGMVLLWLYGVRSRFHNLETTIRRAVESTLTAILGDISDESIINVTLLNPTAVKIHAHVKHQAAEKHLATLARKIGDEIKDGLGYRSDVMVETIPCQTYSTR